MNFTLESLTPLHTGGIDAGKMVRIQEAGIIGSLRWWYEAILRGLGGANRVCDPTGDSKNRCNYEQNDEVCLACDLFGATGWKRRFRLQIDGGVRLFETPNKLAIKALNGNNGWHFLTPFISTSNQKINTRITVLRDREAGLSPIENDLGILLTVISHWGGLGAKTQHGFGVFNQVNSFSFDEKIFLNGLTNSSQDKGLPSLGNMFFAKLRFKSKDDNWWKSGTANLGNGVKENATAWRLEDKPKATTRFSVPSAPAVKHKIRYGQNGNSHLAEAEKCRSDFFGDIYSDPNKKAKLNISNAYKNAQGQWEFRIWGWFPEQQAPPNVARHQLLNELHELVTDSTKYQAFWDGIFGAGVIDLSQTTWRERDTSGHERNTKDALGNIVTPATTAELLSLLLAEK